MNGRYMVMPDSANPFFVWDSLEQKKSSSHDTFESASTRAYILNRFSTGARI
jgi:hypothetical protein